MNTFLDTFALMFGFFHDIFTAWSPLALPIAVVFTLGFFGSKMVRTARVNALVRAERRAREAYRAPVLDLTPRLARQDPNGNIA